MPMGNGVQNEHSSYLKGSIITVTLKVKNKNKKISFAFIIGSHNNKLIRLYPEISKIAVLFPSQARLRTPMASYCFCDRYIKFR